MAKEHMLFYEGNFTISMELQLFRNELPTITIPIDGRTVYTHEIMGVHEIRCEFIAQQPLDIRVDDYIIFRNEHYIINTEFKREKRSNFEYHYTIVFEGYVYLLKDIIFKHLGSIDFSYYGTPQQFVQLVVDNMNADDTGWSVGFVDSAEEMNIEFYRDSEGLTCLAALTMIAEEFGLEFRLTGKTIHLQKEAGQQTNLDFQYGRGKGLYSLTRGALETPLYNRIYGYGSIKNIPYGYRNGAKRLTFQSGKIERPIAAGERRRETSVIFDDIYPHRTGTITGVSADWLSLVDTSLDFDLNGLKIEGSGEPSVVFTSGLLSGNEFVIDSYNHATKTITIAPNEEANDHVLPYANMFPAIGDKYVLINIAMPQSYVDAAEAELRAKTQDAFNQMARPPYYISIDEKYMRDNGVELNAGDRVKIKDTDLDVDDMIRVTAVSFPLVNVNQITATISDKILYTSTVKQIIDTEKIKERVVVVDRTKAELARKNMLQMRKLQNLTFDPDGYFDTDRIKPLSIETGMLSVGAKSQNFGLNGVTINANTEGDPNHLSISSGSLVHYEVEIEGLGYVWQMDSADFTMLDPLKVYYLSARVRTTALSGTWHLSEVPMETESETGYWHFNLGILYPVEDGSRGFDLTKGMTFIVGDRITTGRIQSLDGLNFFDLSQGTFKLGDATTGLDWGVTTPGALTINGFAIAKVVQVGSEGVINARISGLTDQGPLSVRFAAGVNDEFQVLDNGSMIATKGKIGFLDVDSSSLTLGAVPGASDPWISGTNIVRLLASSLMYRKNGPLRGQIKEFAVGVYPDSTIDPFTSEAVRITNNIPNQTLPPIPGDNIALSLIASGANAAGRNIALLIREGEAVIEEAVYVTQSRYSQTDNIICNDTDYLVVMAGGDGRFIRLPAHAKKGRVIKVSITNGVGTAIYAGDGNGVIYAANQHEGTGTTVIQLGSAAEFIFDGINWLCF